MPGRQKKSAASTAHVSPLSLEFAVLETLYHAVRTGSKSVLPADVFTELNDKDNLLFGFQRGKAVSDGSFYGTISRLKRKDFMQRTIKDDAQHYKLTSSGRKEIRHLLLLMHDYMQSPRARKLLNKRI